MRKNVPECDAGDGNWQTFLELLKYIKQIIHLKPIRIYEEVYFL